MRAICGRDPMAVARDAEQGVLMEAEQDTGKVESHRRPSLIVRQPREAG